MHCIAVDDEKLALDLLVDNISQVPYLDLRARCRNTREAVNILQKERIDLVFLDIQMPGLSGMQLVESLVSHPMIIMVTAYENYALEGYNLDVVDYLMKPVAFGRFLKACNKAKALFDLKMGTIHQEDDSVPDHFFVNVEYSLVKIVIDEILYIEGLKDYIKIFLSSADRPVITRMSLKSIAEKLSGDRFIRTHKSYIVSIPKVTAIKRDFVQIGEQELPVSETYKSNISLIIGSSKG